MARFASIHITETPEGYHASIDADGDDWATVEGTDLDAVVESASHYAKVHLGGPFEHRKFEELLAHFRTAS